MLSATCCKAAGVRRVHRLALPLAVPAPVPGKPAPQTAGTTPINWVAAATGGVEPLTYRFELEKGGQAEEAVPTGSAPAWAWRPAEGGDYRVRVVVTDLRGNQSAGAWSAPYEIAPPLVIGRPAAGIPSPQMAGTVAIPWELKAHGGVGEQTILFELKTDKGEPVSMASGPARTWEWRPEQPGLYRVRGVLTDGLGNRLAGDWSETFRIEPPLRIEALSSDRPAPQAALTVSVTWSISAFGGVAPLRYTFELARNDEAGRPVQEGAEAGWQWNPDREGEYRVRVDIEDARGNRVAGSWSPPYAIAPPIAISVPEPDNPADQSLLEVTDPLAGAGKWRRRK